VGFLDLFRTGTGPKAEAPKSGDFSQELGAPGVDILSGLITDVESTGELANGKWFKIAEKMYRQEPAVAAAFRLVGSPIKLAKWRFEYPSGTTPNLEILDYLNKLWDRCSKSWDQTLSQILWFLMYGHMPMEIVLKMEEGKVWLDKLAPRRPHASSRFNADEQGKLISYFQWAQKGGNWQYFEIPADKLILFRNDDAFDNNFEGISLARSAYRNYKMKIELLNSDRFRLMRWGAPIPVFEEPPDESSKSKATRAANETKINNIAYQMRTGKFTYLKKPSGWGFDLEQPDLGTSTIIDSVRYHDAQMFLAFSANVLAVGSGTGSVAQGLGGTLQTVASLGPASIAKYIGAEMDKHLHKRLIDMNFGEQEVYPSFVPGNVKSLQMRDVYPFIVSALQGGGLTHTFDTERYMRDLGDMPTITTEEFETGGAPSPSRRKGRDKLASILNPERSQERPSPGEEPEPEDEEIEEES